MPSASQTHSAAAANSIYPPRALSEGKPSVLLVEDDNYVTAILWMLLKRSGFHVTTAVTGTEGLQLARNGSLDIIVLDVDLPGMSGLDVCRELKAAATTADLPVVFFSGQGNLAGEAFELGAEAFLIKPTDVCRLVDCLHQILNVHPTNESPS